MFRSLFRADSGSDRAPWGDFWYTSLGRGSNAGVRVNADTAMSLSAVYACVHVLAETMATLPFRMFRKKANGGKTPVTDHWLYQLLAKKPNKWQNAFEWREMMQGHLALRGNGYNWIIGCPAGSIAELQPIHPNLIRPEYVNNTFTGIYLVQNGSGQGMRVPRGEIFHLRGLSSNGVTGMNPIEVQAENIGYGMAAQQYGARFFKNDARPLGGWIEFPGQFADQEKRKAFIESWQKGQGGNNRGKTAVLDRGMKFHEVGINNREAQFIEARRQSVEDIARMFRVPPHLIGDLSRSTNNNIEQQSLEFVNFTMTPWVERWEYAIEDQLMPPDADFEVEFDFANLLRGDAEARTAYYQGGILNGWLTRNEARIAENLDPIEGLDEPLQPMNMVEAGEEPPEPVPPKVAPPDDAPPNDDDDEDSKAIAARLEAMQMAAASRVARKEIAALAKLSNVEERRAFFSPQHAAFIAEALAVDLAAAENWCAYRAKCQAWDANTAPDSAEKDETKLAGWLIKRACACTPVKGEK